MADPSPSLSTVRDLKSADVASGTPFASLLILRKVSTRMANNGNPYLSVEMGDKGGSFTSTVFSDSPAFAILKAADEGSVVRVEGKVDTYQNRFSPKLTRVSVVPEDELGSSESIASLVETAPEDGDALWTEFKAFADLLSLAELRATVANVMDEIGESFRTAPAATAMHHAYRHGLLEHTVHMARACRALLPLYPEVDPDLAMAGILLHDCGKTAEYEGALSARRGRRGLLQGHVVLGYQLVRKAALKARLDPDRVERLEHIILSHQGKLEWGAAVLAATPEAVFVSKIDELDAKMGMVQRALRNAQDGDEFTERILGLDMPLLVKRLPD
jgi:3'-5' exoribonuclease